MALKIINKFNKFLSSSYSALDRALNRMAIDIERLSKQQVPHDKGQLKASGYHRKVGILKYIVAYNKEYAHFQEVGGDPDRGIVVRKYSKPGKKKYFLRDPANIIEKRSMEYIVSESARIKL